MIRTIAVVGNGPVNPALSREIDAHDLVIRFNSARHCGIAGTRTDILVLNNVGAAGAAILSDIDADAIGRVGEMWLAHRPRLFFRRERADWAAELSALFPAATPRRYFPMRASSATKRTLRTFGAVRGTTASKGAVMIHIALHKWPQAKLSLYGFGHQGWDGHDWDAERAWVDALVAGGRVVRTETLSPSAAALLPEA